MRVRMAGSSPPLRELLPLMQERIVHATRYFGVQTLKNPLDFWVYQELITGLRPDVIVEVGNRFGTHPPAWPDIL
jgi:cephalosporin hydroxylase